MKPSLFPYNPYVSEKTEKGVLFVHTSYPLAVLTKQNGKSLIGLMRQFSGYHRVPPYLLYTKNQIIENEKQEIEYIKNNMYAKYLANPEAYNQPNDAYCDFLRNEFPKQLEWTDEQIYEFGIKKYPKYMVGPSGEVYSTQNPNIKWNHYKIGGEWNNLLRLKNGKRATEALIKDIDFSPDMERYQKALLWWENNIDRREPQQGEERLPEWLIPNRAYYDKLYGSKETYAKMATLFHTFAILTPNGEWYEKAKIDKSGIDINTYQTDFIWESNYYDFFIRPADPEWKLTIVECEI